MDEVITKAPVLFSFSAALWVCAVAEQSYISGREGVTEERRSSVIGQARMSNTSFSWFHFSSSAPVSIRTHRFFLTHVLLRGASPPLLGEMLS